LRKRRGGFFESTKTNRQPAPCVWAERYQTRRGEATGRLWPEKVDGGPAKVVRFVSEKPSVKTIAHSDSIVDQHRLMAGD